MSYLEGRQVRVSRWWESAATLLVHSVLCTKMKPFTTMLTTIKFIPFYMHSHVGVCVAFVFVTVHTEITCVPHSIMLTDMPVEVPQVFEGTSTVFMHTR